MLPTAAMALIDVAQVSLRDMAIVLGVAAITTVVFQRLRQPVVLGYLLAGIILGPHTPGTTVHDLATLHFLSELGVILVFFAIGLEFSLRRMIGLGPRPAFVAIFQAGAMLWLGFLCGRAMGLDWRTSLFLGAIIAISSTVLIERVFAEADVEKPIRETVLGILIYEDVIGILLLAGLSALAVGETFDVGVVTRTGGKLVAFLAIVLVLGFALVPGAMRFVLSLRRRETLIVASLGLCFALSYLAGKAGFSTALGAFLAGSLIAESGHGHEIHRRTQPIGDVFTAIFFVSIGMQVDPRQIAEHWVAILALTVVTVVGKLVSTALGTFLVGEDRQTALRSGICMAQIGEFAFIIAGLGVATKTIPAWIAAAAVGVSTITAFVTPYLIGNSARLAKLIDRSLPDRLQTMATLYTAWLADIKERGSSAGPWRTVAKPLRIVALDAFLLGAFVIAGALLAEEMATFFERKMGVGTQVAIALVVAGVTALCVPLLFGIVNGSRSLGSALAAIAMPSVEPGRLDLARAPRRALVVSLQLAVILCVALPLLAITDPFLPRYSTPAVLAAMVFVLTWILWRTAADLQGHVSAGAAVIAEALSRSAPQDEPRELSEVTKLMPGFGDLTMLSIPAESPAAGRTLAELDLRGLSGASVIAIQRGARRIVMPTGSESVHAGDLLALAGSSEEVDAAIDLLRGEDE